MGWGGWLTPTTYIQLAGAGSNSPASTIKAIDHDLHYYHFYGNNASRLLVPNITNKVKRKTCGPCVSFRNFSKDIFSFNLDMRIFCKNNFCYLSLGTGYDEMI